MLPDIVKINIEEVLQGILYKEKTLEVIDQALEGIRTVVDNSTTRALGKNWFVGYLSCTDNILKFAITHRENENEEYVVDVVTLGPAGWDENKKVEPVDPDNTDDLTPSQDDGAGA
jgi:hypothetical protein